MFKDKIEAIYEKNYLIRKKRGRKKCFRIIKSNIKQAARKGKTQVHIYIEDYYNKTVSRKEIEDYLQSLGFTKYQFSEVCVAGVWVYWGGDK